MDRQTLAFGLLVALAFPAPSRAADAIVDGPAGGTVTSGPPSTDGAAAPTGPAALDTPAP